MKFVLTYETQDFFHTERDRDTGKETKPLYFVKVRIVPLDKLALIMVKSQTEIYVKISYI